MRMVTLARRWVEMLALNSQSPGQSLASSEMEKMTHITMKWNGGRIRIVGSEYDATKNVFGDRSALSNVQLFSFSQTISSPQLKLTH